MRKDGLSGLGQSIIESIFTNGLALECALKKERGEESLYSLLELK